VAMITGLFMVSPIEIGSMWTLAWGQEIQVIGYEGLYHPHSSFQEGGMGKDLSPIYKTHTNDLSLVSYQLYLLPIFWPLFNGLTFVELVLLSPYGISYNFPQQFVVVVVVEVMGETIMELFADLRLCNTWNLDVWHEILAFIGAIGNSNKYIIYLNFAFNL
jgi:hypothetical protein